MTSSLAGYLYFFLASETRPHSLTLTSIRSTKPLGMYIVIQIVAPRAITRFATSQSGKIIIDCSARHSMEKNTVKFCDCMIQLDQIDSFCLVGWFLNVPVSNLAI